MTFSICVHKPYADADGDEQHRFGVAVTTRLAGVGTLCPFVSENGTDATRSLVNVRLGRKGIEYVDDGLANDSDPDGSLNASSVTIWQSPTNGTITVNESTDAVTHTHDRSSTTEDSFTYTVKGDGVRSNEATVAIDVI